MSTESGEIVDLTVGEEGEEEVPVKNGEEEKGGEVERSTNQAAKEAELPAARIGWCDQLPSALPALLCENLRVGQGGDECVGDNCLAMPLGWDVNMSTQGTHPSFPRTSLVISGMEMSEKGSAGPLALHAREAGMNTSQNALMAMDGLGELELANLAQAYSENGTPPSDLANIRIPPLEGIEMPSMGGMYQPVWNSQFLHTQSWLIPVPPVE